MIKLTIRYVIEEGYFIGWVPEFPGAISQAGSLEEMKENLMECIEILNELNLERDSERGDKLIGYPIKEIKLTFRQQ